MAMENPRTSIFTFALFGYVKEYFLMLKRTRRTLPDGWDSVKTSAVFWGLAQLHVALLDICHDPCSFNRWTDHPTENVFNPPTWQLRSCTINSNSLPICNPHPQLVGRLYENDHLNSSESCGYGSSLEQNNDCANTINSWPISSSEQPFRTSLTSQVSIVQDLTGNRDGAGDGWWRSAAFCRLPLTLCSMVGLLPVPLLESICEVEMIHRMPEKCWQLIFAEASFLT